MKVIILIFNNTYTSLYVNNVGIVVSWNGALNRKGWLSWAIMINSLTVK